MRRVSLVCADHVGTRMAGPGIRAVELGRALAAARFDVTIAARANGDVPDVGAARFCALGASSRDPQAARLARESEVLIVQGDVLLRWPALRRTSAALIADLYCPIPLEAVESAPSQPMGARMVASSQATAVVADQILYADHFLCASERQMDLWTGSLMALGRINPLRFGAGQPGRSASLFTIVPFGTSDAAPVRGRTSVLRSRFGIGADELVLLWGGGVYEWFDPETIVTAVARLAERGRRAHLVFLGGAHPGASADHANRIARLRELARRLGVVDRLVHFNDEWIAYGQHHAWLADADIGVTSHLDTLETRFAYRTRVVDYIGAGLPVITTQGDHFSGTVRERGIGRVVGYGDVDDWCRAIGELADPALRTRCADAAREVARELSWSRVVTPLASVCEELVAAPDRKLSRGSQIARAVRADQTTIARARRAYRRGGMRAVVNAATQRLLGSKRRK